MPIRPFTLEMLRTLAGAEDGGQAGGGGLTAIDLLAAKYQFRDVDAHTPTVVQAYGCTVPTSVGTSSIIRDAEGVWQRRTRSAASATGIAGWDLDTTPAIRSPWKTVCVWRFRSGNNWKSPGVGNVIRSWCMFGTNTMTAADDPGLGGVASTVGFRYSTTVPDSNWIACSAAGANVETIDTGVPMENDTIYTLCVDMNSGVLGGQPTQIDYYVGSLGAAPVLVASVTNQTNMPAVGTNMQSQLMVSNGGGNQHQIYIDLHFQHWLTL